jgi:hypothetical protein
MHSIMVLFQRGEMQLNNLAALMKLQILLMKFLSIGMLRQNV